MRSSGLGREVPYNGYNGHGYTGTTMATLRRAGFFRLFESRPAQVQLVSGKLSMPQCQLDTPVAAQFPY